MTVAPLPFEDVDFLLIRPVIHRYRPEPSTLQPVPQVSCEAMMSAVPGNSG